MKVSSKIRYLADHTEHVMEIRHFPSGNLVKQGDWYILTAMKEYDHQTFRTTIRLHCKIVEKRENIVFEHGYIQWEKQYLHVYLRKKNIDQLMDRIHFQYESQYEMAVDGKMFAENEVIFHAHFYHQQVRPRIRKINFVRKKSRQAQVDSYSTPADLRKKDQYETTRKAFQYSPNSDGKRSRLEVLGGNFSGESQYRR